MRNHRINVGDLRVGTEPAMAARTYGCACGARVQSVNPKYHGWRLMSTGGAILWCCPSCVASDHHCRECTPLSR
jgi:hypothetical protein